MFSPPQIAGYSVGQVPLTVFDACSYFASGVGAAGLVGAFLSWGMCGLGVRVG